MPKNLSALATVLRFAFRFRWEVLEKFAGSAMTKFDVERLDIALRRMEAEWQSRGVGDQVDIENMLPRGEARDRITRMQKHWALVRNPQGTGELDVAIKKRIQKRFAKSSSERFLGTRSSLKSLQTCSPNLFTASCRCGSEVSQCSRQRPFVDQSKFALRPVFGKLWARQWQPRRRESRVPWRSCPPWSGVQTCRLA
jgi:hypothetical protein